MMTSTNTLASATDAHAASADEYTAAAYDDFYDEAKNAACNDANFYDEAKNAAYNDANFYDEAKNEAYNDANDESHDESNDDSIDEYVHYCGMWGCEFDEPSCETTAKEVVPPWSLSLRMKTYVPLSLTMMSFWWLCFVPLLLVIVVLPFELLYALFKIVFTEHCLVNGQTIRDVDMRPNITETIN